MTEEIITKGVWSFVSTTVYIVRLQIFSPPLDTLVILIFILFTLYGLFILTLRPKSTS